MLDIDRERNIEILRQACHAYDQANRQLLDKVRQLTQEVADLQGLDAAQIGLDLPEVHFRPESESPQKSKAPAPKADSTASAQDRPRPDAAAGSSKTTRRSSLRSIAGLLGL